MRQVYVGVGLGFGLAAAALLAGEVKVKRPVRYDAPPKWAEPRIYKTRNTTQPRSPRQSWFKKSSKR